MKQGRREGVCGPAGLQSPPGVLPGAGMRQEMAKVGPISAEGFSRDHPAPRSGGGCAGISPSPIHAHGYTFPTKQLNRQFPFAVKTHLSDSKSPYV